MTARNNSPFMPWVRTTFGMWERAPKHADIPRLLYTVAQAAYDAGWVLTVERRRLIVAFLKGTTYVPWNHDQENLP